MKSKVRAVFIGFALGGGLVFIGYQVVGRYSQRVAYGPPREASTLANTLEPVMCEATNKSPAWPCVPYDYRINGITYRGHMPAYQIQPSSGALKELRQLYPPGSKIRVTYETKNPAFSYVKTEDARLQ
jgi:hypothetical protein